MNTLPKLLIGVVFTALCWSAFAGRAEAKHPYFAYPTLGYRIGDFQIGYSGGYFSAGFDFNGWSAFPPLYSWYGGWGWPGYGCYGPYYSYRPYYNYAPAYRPFYGPFRWGGYGVTTLPLYARDVRPKGVGPKDVLVKAASGLATKRSAVRRSSAEAKRRAIKFVSYGDRYFRQQKYYQGLQRYKLAAQAAPDMADAHLRKGVGMAATKNFSLAAKAFKKALEVDPKITLSTFSLNEIYDEWKESKQHHLDAAAQAALDDPRNADLFFVLGVMLYFDGASKRAEKFFARAASLSKHVGLYARHFLPEPKADGATPRRITTKAKGTKPTAETPRLTRRLPSRGDEI